MTDRSLHTTASRALMRVPSSVVTKRLFVQRALCVYTREDEILYT